MQTGGSPRLYSLRKNGLEEDRCVSGHDLGRAERTSVRVRNIENKALPLCRRLARSSRFWSGALLEPAKLAASTHLGFSPGFSEGYRVHASAYLIGCLSANEVVLEEIRAGINHRILTVMEQIEAHDWAVHEKQRLTLVENR